MSYLKVILNKYCMVSPITPHAALYQPFLANCTSLHAAQRPSVGASAPACVCQITAPIQQSLLPQLSAFLSQNKPLIVTQALTLAHFTALSLHKPGPRSSAVSEAVWGGGCLPITTTPLSLSPPDTTVDPLDSVL